MKELGRAEGIGSSQAKLDPLTLGYILTAAGLEAKEKSQVDSPDLMVGKST